MTSPSAYSITRPAGLLLVALALACAGCGGTSSGGGQSSAAKSGSGAGSTSLQVAASQAATPNLPLYWAYQQGYFRDEHLNVTIIPGLSQGSVSVAAVLSGKATLGFTSATDIMTAQEHNQSLKIVASDSIAPPPGGGKGVVSSSQVLVAPSSQIHTYGDLAGKTVAVSALRTDVQLLIDGLVTQAGKDANSVKFVEIPPASMLAALKSGRVDAITPNTPYNIDALHAGMRSIGDYSVLAPRISHSYIFATGNWLNGHPAAAAGFVKALNKATRYCVAHVAQCRETVLTKYFHLSSAQAAKTPLVNMSTSLEPGAIKSEANLAYKFKWMQQPVNFDGLFWKSPAVLAGM